MEKELLVLTVREQIQEDILTYIESIQVTQSWKTMGFRYKAELCQVVVERFNEYIKKND